MFEHGYALLIGVDQNRVASLALPIVKKDVTKLKDVITHPERCGYLEDKVRVLTGTEATREKILEGLDWLKVRLKADADTNQTAFIYYSGHAHREASGESFLIPYDARFPVRLGGLAAKDFAEGIDSIRPRRLLVVLDCCHAERLNVKDAKANGLTSAAVTPETPGIGLLAEGDGRAVLSSSRGSQQSWIRNDGQMSVFTYHLVEALTGHTGRPAWPEVTVTEVMEYVGRTVPATAGSQHNAEQEPVFRYSGTAFPIALVLGGKGVEKGVAAPDPLAELPLRVQSTLTVEKVEGEATNIEIEDMRRGELDATTTAEEVGKGGKLTGVKIDTIGGDTVGGDKIVTEAKQQVQVSSYYPTEVKPELWYTLLAYVHVKSAQSAVHEDSQIRLGQRHKNYGKGHGKTTETIARGTEIVVVPEIPGCRFNPTKTSVLWLEDWHRIEFRMQASERLPGFALNTAVNGRLSFYVGPILVADIKLWAHFSDDVDSTDAEWAATSCTSDPYQAVFVSYSHSDRQIVQELEKAYVVLGMKYLRDVRVLRSGEKWNSALLKKIEQADIFQLCWSTTAKTSTYVEQEWRHALKLQRQSFIRPFYWETPMPLPPEELADVHFAYLTMDPTGSP